MNINSLTSFLKPKENKFFPMIQAIADNLVGASSTFKTLVHSHDINEARTVKTQMKEFELKGDDLLNKVQFELNNTFITPFDREDIQTLCEHLDNVLDALNSLSKRIVLYQPSTMQQHLESASEIITNCCLNLQIIAQNLKSVQKNPKEVLEACKNLHALEQQGDDLYDATTARIFSEETDAVEIIKDKGIMSYVEGCIDETYTVSKLVKTMIVKYA
jgi:uncharacterized protein Yka (UPF0111/DUF47 family)